MGSYIYRVVSNKPVALIVGIGNMPNISHSEHGLNLTQRDLPLVARSNGAACSVGHVMSLELVELED